MATTVTGTIKRTKHLRNSASANPRFEVTLTDGRVFETKPDSAVNYDIENLENAGKPVEFVLERGKIATFTR